MQCTIADDFLCRNSWHLGNLQQEERKRGLLDAGRECCTLSAFPALSDDVVLVRRSSGSNLNSCKNAEKEVLAISVGRKGSNSVGRKGSLSGRFVLI